MLNALSFYKRFTFHLALMGCAVLGSPLSAAAVFVPNSSTCSEVFAEYCSTLVRIEQENSSVAYTNTVESTVDANALVVYLSVLLSQSQGTDPLEILAKVGNAMYQAEQGNVSFLLPPALALNPELFSHPSVQQFIRQYGTELLLGWVERFRQQFLNLPPEVIQILTKVQNSASLELVGSLGLGALFTNQPQSLTFLSDYLSSVNGPFHRENVINFDKLESSFPLFPVQATVKKKLVNFVENNPSVLGYHNAMIARLLDIRRFSNLTPVRIDIPFAYQERYSYAAVSGSTLADRFEAVPCYEKLCRQVELYPVAGTPQSIFPGGKFVVWIDRAQKVEGGVGPLVGQEPTGQKPFHSSIPFKIVIERINEARGEVEFRLYKQRRFPTKDGEIATPHIYGPILIPNIDRTIVRGRLKEGEIIYISAAFALSPNTGAVASSPSQLQVSTLPPTSFTPIKPSNSTAPKSSNSATATTPKKQQQQNSNSSNSSKSRTSNLTLISSGTPSFIYPVNAPVTSAYGWRIHPIQGYKKFHAGVDFGAPTGTPIKAAADSCVVEAGWIRGYGNTIILKHGNGWETLYAHLSKIAVRPGDCVKRNHVIGYVGSTGQSTGPHLHFEISHNGKPLEPLQFLSS